MKPLVLLVLVACGHPEAVEPSAPQPLPAHSEIVLDTTPKQPRRMIPPEAFLRAYLNWFGGLAPIQIQKDAHGHDLFDTWNAYLGALGLPDYRLDIPRASQTNTVMLAALGRLGEALCVRAAQHDLHQRTPLASRIVFAFEAIPHPTLAQFRPMFDVLHRTFLSYPADLAPASRIQHYYDLYREVAARHAGGQLLTADETAWAAVCSALVQHPEAELY